MAGQAETTRRPQRGGSGLAGLGKIVRGVAFGPLRLATLPLGFLFGMVLLLLKAHGGLAALLAQLALLSCGRDEDRGVQLPLAHRPSPRFAFVPVRRTGCSYGVMARALERRDGSSG